MRTIKKVVFEVNYGDLERAIQEHFDFIEYSICAAEEVGNDSALTFNIDAKPLDEWELKDLEEMKKSNGNKGWRTHLLMQAMCIDGVIEPGEYLIQISW